MPPPPAACSTALPPAEVLDDLTGLTAAVCEVPIVVATLIEGEWLRFASRIGVEIDGLSCDTAFCAIPIRERELLVCPDLSADARFAHHPLVAGEPHLRFYAGMPLLGSDGQVLGTLCIIDLIPRTLTPAQERTLRVLSRQVVMQYELARRHTQELSESEARSRAIVESALDAIITIDHTDRIVDFNPAAEQVFGWPRAEVIGRDLAELLIPPAVRAQHRAAMEQHLATRVARVLDHRLEVEALRRDGSVFPVELTVTRLGTSEPPQFTAFLRDLSLVRQADAELRASLKENADLRAALDEHAIVARTDAAGRITFANDKFCAISQYSREELLGHDHQIIHSGEHPPEFFRELWATISSGTVWHGEICNRAKDGSTYWVDTTIVPFLGADGKPEQYIAIRSDISARKRTEQQLTDAVAFAQATIDALSSHICVLDETGLILATNTAWDGFNRTHRDLGAPVTPGANYLAICDVAAGAEAAEASEFSKGLRAIIQGDLTSFEMEYPCDGPDDHRWFVARVTRFPSGGPVRVVVAHDDITTRKLAEEARRASEAKYRALFEHAPDGIVIATREGRLLEVNASLCRMLGLARSELIDRHLVDFLAPEEHADLPARLEAISGHGAPRREWQLLHGDGSTFPVEVIGAPMPDGHLLALIRDASERKKLEEQFFRAQRLESIGTLAGGIAHDLNNVLSPILMSLNLLRTRFKDPASEELISLIHESAQHGADMVRQVLSFARGVEGRKLELQVGHLIRGVEKIANDTFLKNIKVRTSVAPDLWAVIGDPTHLHQVLMNLSVNARDAMPNGGTLSISAENLRLDEHYAALNLEARPGPYVVLRIEDTGIGIPPGALEKIFDPFFTTKEIGQGTGLGLSTTLAIVKSHGGFIRVQSQPSKGTKFEIYLPAEPSADPAASTAKPPESPRGHEELILVIDDESSVRRITQQTLEAYGYRVVLASDGAEGLAVFARQSKEIAAVLTDMTMPVMGGASAIQILRRMDPTLPIIATSGLAGRGPSSYAADLARLGVPHFLEKPFVAEALLTTLHEVLRARPSASPSGRNLIVD